MVQKKRERKTYRWINCERYSYPLPLEANSHYHLLAVVVEVLLPSLPESAGRLLLMNRPCWSSIQRCILYRKINVHNSWNKKKKKKTRLQDKGIQRYIFYSYSYSHSLYQRNSIIFPVFRSSPQRFIIIIVSEGMPLIAQVDNLIANQTLSINITLYNYGLSYIWYQIYLFATFVNFARIKHQLFLIILHAFNFVWYFFLNTDNFSLRMNIISYAGKNGPRQPKPTPLMNVPI